MLIRPAAIALKQNAVTLQALAVSLQGTPSGLDGVQDPALVRNILRTLLGAQAATLPLFSITLAVHRGICLSLSSPRIRMVAFEDCPTRSSAATLRPEHQLWLARRACAAEFRPSVSIPDDVQVLWNLSTLRQSSCSEL